MKNDTIFFAIKRHAEQNPQKIAVSDFLGFHSYGQFFGEICEAAFCLKKLGVKKGERVLIECTQDVNFLILCFACNLLEAVFVPLEKDVKKEKANQIFFQVKAKHIFLKSHNNFQTAILNYQLGCTPPPPQKIFCQKNSVFENSNLLKNFEKNFFLPCETSISEILFSTGTTGKPKGIAISHKANVAIAQNIKFGVGIKPSTVEIVPLPLSHSHALRTCYANFFSGSSVAIFDGITNVAGFFDAVEKQGVNALDLSPTLAGLLVKIAKSGLEKIRKKIDFIEIGTASLDFELRSSLKKIFPDTKIFNFYGSTEAGRTCLLNIQKEDFPNCVGRPSKNAEFFVVDENRNPIKSSKQNVGLIAVKGKMMMEGYFEDEALTRKFLHRGVLYTSDLGYIDEEGRVYVLGRKDFVINCKGIKIAPEEIESVAQKFVGVADCACVPESDAICGQVPRLFVQAKNSKFDIKKFKAFLKENLEPQRLPKFVELVDFIPKASNGKIQRKKLSQMKGVLL